MDCKILTFLKLAAWDFVCIGVHTPHLCSLGTQHIQPEVHKSQRQQRQQWLWTLAHLLAFKRQEWKVWEKERKMIFTMSSENFPLYSLSFLLQWMMRGHNAISILQTCFSGKTTLSLPQLCYDASNPFIQCYSMFSFFNRSKELLLDLLLDNTLQTC